MKRRYEILLSDHFKHDYQMAFITGPRQVGKTTSCMAFGNKSQYFNWDSEDDRLLVISGPSAVADSIGANEAGIIIFDELHKYPQWKNFLKGFYDTRARNRFNVVVTGSARLDIYRAYLHPGVGIRIIGLILFFVVIINDSVDLIRFLENT